MESWNSSAPSVSYSDPKLGVRDDRERERVRSHRCGTSPTTDGGVVPLAVPTRDSVSLPRLVCPGRWGSIHTGAVGRPCRPGPLFWAGPYGAPHRTELTVYRPVRLDPRGGSDPTTEGAGVDRRRVDRPTVPEVSSTPRNPRHVTSLGTGGGGKWTQRWWEVPVVGVFVGVEAHP